MNMKHSLVALLTVLLLLSAGCSGDSKKAGEQAADNKTENATVAGYEVMDPISVTAEDVNAIVRDADAGVVVLNMWATWCKPCVEEFPDLVRLQKEYGDRGLRLILVSADFQHNLAQVNAFLAEEDVDFQTYLKGQKDQEFITGLHPEWSGTLPATVFYNSEGEAVEFHQGKLTWDEMKTRVENLLEGS
ncbi:redoxin domain-containing protein [bacterium]|nr:redoxin domain-containing protein [bacterium]